PVAAQGDCLAPLFPAIAAAPRTLWFDPTLPAVDGDYVVVQPSEACMTRMLARFHYSEPSTALDAARERFAPRGVANNLKGKLLRMSADGRAWITNKDVAMPLETYGTILGVVRKIEPKQQQSAQAEDGGEAGASGNARVIVIDTNANNVNLRSLY